MVIVLLSSGGHGRLSAHLRRPANPVRQARHRAPQYCITDIHRASVACSFECVHVAAKGVPFAYGRWLWLYSISKRNRSGSSRSKDAVTERLTSSTNSEWRACSQWSLDLRTWPTTSRTPRESSSPWTGSASSRRMRCCPNRCGSPTSPPVQRRWACPRSAHPWGRWAASWARPSVSGAYAPATSIYRTRRAEGSSHRMTRRPWRCSRPMRRWPSPMRGGTGRSRGPGPTLRR